MALRLQTYGRRETETGTGAGRHKSARRRHEL